MTDRIHSERLEQAVGWRFDWPSPLNCMRRSCPPWLAQDRAIARPGVRRRLPGTFWASTPLRPQSFPCDGLRSPTHPTPYGVRPILRVSGASCEGRDGCGYFRGHQAH